MPNVFCCSRDIDKCSMWYILKLPRLWKRISSLGHHSGRKCNNTLRSRHGLKNLLLACFHAYMSWHFIPDWKRIYLISCFWKRHYNIHGFNRDECHMEPKAGAETGFFSPVPRRSLVTGLSLFLLPVFHFWGRGGVIYPDQDSSLCSTDLSCCVACVSML